MCNVARESGIYYRRLLSISRRRSFWRRPSDALRTGFRYVYDLVIEGNWREPGAVGRPICVDEEEGWGVVGVRRLDDILQDVAAAAAARRRHSELCCSRRLVCVAGEGRWKGSGAGKTRCEEKMERRHGGALYERTGSCNFSKLAAFKHRRSQPSFTVIYSLYTTVSILFRCKTILRFVASESPVTLAA